MSIQISDRSVTVLLADITTDFYVRKQLDADWALQLALMVENGVDFDAIYITRDKKAIDGRHRIEAHEIAGKTEIKARYVDADNDAELIAFALKCNIGSGKPASKEDIEHTMQILLDRGVPKRELAATLSMLPEKVVKTYLKDLEARHNRAKLAKAAAAIVDGGLSLGKAAEQYNVDEGELKSLISGRTRRKTAKNGVEEMKRTFSKTYQGQGNRTAKSISRLLEMYADGDVTHKQVLELFNHVDRLLKKGTRAIDNHRKRFEAMETPKKLTE